MQRDVLLKILNESQVLEGIATKDLQQIVGKIVRTNTITFNKDELAPQGTGILSPCILFLSAREWSSVSTHWEQIRLKCLPDHDSKPHGCRWLSHTTTRYDGPSLWRGKNFSLRVINLKMLIRPCEFEVSFILVNIPRSSIYFSGIYRYTWPEPFHLACIIGSNSYQVVNLSLWWQKKMFLSPLPLWCHLWRTNRWTRLQNVTLSSWYLWAIWGSSRDKTFRSRVDDRSTVCVKAVWTGNMFG